MKKDFDYEQMLSSELYFAASILPENGSIQGKVLSQEINKLPISERNKIVDLERKLFGKVGKNIYVNPPVYVDYGKHVEIGDNFYANMDCIFLDVNKITIGNNVMVGPRVSFYTAGHPIDSDVRISELEYGLPITVQDNVWIGGNSVVLPGINIGKNSVIAAGSIVTKDVPADVIVGGNPARVIREITKKDKHFWDKKRKEYENKKNNFI